MGRRSCSSCGGTGQVSRSRMGSMNYETYYESCMVCSGRGYHHVPDPPSHARPRRQSAREKRLAAAEGKTNGHATTAKVDAPKRPRQEATFEGFMGLVVAVAAVWLAREGGAQMPWWGWVLLFFVPLIGVTKLLDRYPKHSKLLKKLLIGGTLIAVVGYFLSQGGG